MAASQVEALRQAYAGVMLNMAQESAARVLAAERRAASLAAGLAAAKEDGVAALVRLKAIMDARIKEVELRSLQHVKKIKELEEQLQSLQQVKMKDLEEQLYGAQNSVAALQFELQEANTELEKTRKTLAEERTIDTCVVPVIAEENGAAQNMQNIYRRSPDLPSFMERNKKPKLYHSGCTQRIHALKQRNQGADACQEQNRKHASGLNSRSKIRKNDAAKNPSHTRSIMEQLLQTKFLGKCKRKRGSRSRPCFNHDSSGEIREAESKLSDTSDGNGCLLLLEALEQDLSPPKVSARHGANRKAESPELIDILAAKDVLVQKRKRSKTVRVLEAEFSDSKCVPESAPGNNGPVLQPTTKNLMHQDDANNGQLEPGNGSTVILQSIKNEVTDCGSLLMAQLEHHTPDNNSASLKVANGEGSCSLASGKADASTLIPLDKEENLKASSGLSIEASEKTDAPVSSSLYKEQHAKLSSEVSMQVEGARHIKYTFNRRKRKCVSMDSTPLCVPGKSGDLPSAPKEAEPHPNAEPQDNLIDSPQGENQLVQVAQQLILLSERN
ncbi:hypothetical protein PR202_gb08906 [Eleusine coracana subsp. coracana]|uniref:Uncharacterized protein n=1 Tax=Eleusine coracana subsp. coracana TaxID=191504 RepID=A0AAV5EDE9_ELECO|nr:hypothetical protein PR202_gb08906 [Eleusine coracana subsp. coracana]